MNTLHVHKRAAGGWRLARSKQVRGGRVFLLKKSAVHAARKKAASKGLTLYIHRRDGTVERRVR